MSWTPVTRADAQSEDRFGRFSIGLIGTAAAVLDPEPQSLRTAGQFIVEFDEPEPLDPGRAAATGPLPEVNDRQPSPLSRQRRGQSPTAWAMAIAVYVVTLLILWPWNYEPTPPPPPIPVTLVVEKPPAPRPTPPVEQKKPPGRLASDEMGEVAPPKPEAAAPPSPPEEKVAAITPPPKPSPPPELESLLPKPSPSPDEAALPEIPKPAPEYKEAPPKHPVVARLPPHREPAPHVGKVPGPDATRSEYLAYIRALTQQHLNLLPLSMIEGRSGTTILTILVLDDGRIGRIAIMQGSGYRDIDERVERMVAAVGRYPPLPQWIQEPSMEIIMRFRFPYDLTR